MSVTRSMPRKPSGSEQNQYDFNLSLPVRVEGVVAHPIPVGTVHETFTSHGSYDLRAKTHLLRGYKPLDYLYPAGTGGCGNLRFSSFPSQSYWFLLGFIRTLNYLDLKFRTRLSSRPYLYGGIWSFDLRHPFRVEVSSRSLRAIV